ncbi:ATP-binding protein [Thiomicrorhabdus sp. Milos-T2]|uniref:ATP-binding protein n=1 Tax=Thiomicrorhabdus sp. Milos-T2 TaxID=90814 RepID=UPI00068BD4B9|nr:ATP-binding protein [Thiomicrorhabdus sp. Milos-T2]
MASPIKQTGLSSLASQAIIVVGMNDEHQAQLLANLKPSHFAISFCESPSNANQLLQSTRFDNTVILLDESLFDSDNAQLIAAFLKSHDISQYPCILNVYSSESEAILKAYEMNISFYLVQPYSGRFLQSVIETASKNLLQYSDAIQRIHNFDTAHPLIQQASFFIKTVEEAHALSSALAYIIKEPKRIGIGLFELMLNAIEHGNLGIGYELKSQLIKESRLQQEIEKRQALTENQHKHVQVVFERTPKYIEITISDHGEGFNYSRYLEYAEHRAADKHGRGIMLAKSISFDSLEYKNNGSTAVCRCNID